jgi:hypothetical protein
MGPPIRQNNGNGILHSTHSMPQKDINSMCDADFSRERNKYVETSKQPPVKKWFGNRDASATIARRKTVALGKGSLTTAPAPFHLASHNNIHDTADALRRVRGSGYITTPKVRANPANGLTPSWPAGPLVRSTVNTKQCFITAPKKVNSMNPLWKTTVADQPPLNQASNVIGDPVNGQYTTMRMKSVIPPPSTIFDTGLVGHVRHKNHIITYLPPLYH